jgi:predicted RNase H-like HicB family nuclease
MLYNSSMVRFALSDYVEEALALATYDKLKDDSFVGKIPPLKGVIAFGSTLRECENELRSTLEDWLIIGSEVGHTIPKLGSTAS